MFNKKLYLLALTLLVSLAGFSQNTRSADTGALAADGKIYVVMAVVLTILAGLLFYVFRLDKKITKLEKGDLS